MSDFSLTLTNGAGEKTCTRCRYPKPFGAFYLRPDGKPLSWCKSCKRDYDTKNKDVIAAKSLALRRDTAEGWAKYLIASVKARSRKQGLPPPDLTWDDLARMREISLTCPYHPEIVLTYFTGIGCPTTATLDRIRPPLGYVRGNCILISNRANRQKQDMSLAEMRNIIAVTERLLGAGG